MPHFIAISNGAPDKSEIISAGNERVIRARLADAQFFFRADCDQPLESYLPQLSDVTFQEDSRHDGRQGESHCDNRTAD